MTNTVNELTMIYSEANERMIHKGFTFENVYGEHHFTWNEADEVYYSDEVDDKYYFLDTAEKYVETRSNYWWD